MKTVKDERCDVCIIGGGLIGTSIASNLARVGTRTFLIEKGELASGASGVSFGWAAPNFASYIPNFPRFHMQFMRAGMEAFRSAVKALGDAVEYRPCGGMSLIYTKEHLIEQRRLSLALRNENMDIELISREVVLAQEPLLSGSYIGAVWSPTDVLANPVLLVNHFADEAIRSGAQIVTGATATGLILDRGRVRGVLTPTRRVMCDVVVNAAGIQASEIGDMAGIRIPIRPDRGQQILLERTSPILGAAVYGRIPAAQLATGHILLGGVRENVGFDKKVTIDGLGFICREASEMLPKLRTLNVEKTFAGLRPVPLDGLPILGWAPGVQGLVLANLHAGFTLSVYVGKLITELLTSGKIPEIMEPYGLTRFARQ